MNTNPANTNTQQPLAGAQTFAQQVFNSKNAFRYIPDGRQYQQIYQQQPAPAMGGQFPIQHPPAYGGYVQNQYMHGYNQPAFYQPQPQTNYINHGYNGMQHNQFQPTPPMFVQPPITIQNQIQQQQMQLVQQRSLNQQVNSVDKLKLKLQDINVPENKIKIQQELIEKIGEARNDPLKRRLAVLALKESFLCKNIMAPDNTYLKGLILRKPEKFILLPTKSFLPPNRQPQIKYDYYPQMGRGRGLRVEDNYPQSNLSQGRGRGRGQSFLSNDYPNHQERPHQFVLISDQQLENIITKHFNRFTQDLQNNQQIRFNPDYFQVFQDLKQDNNRQYSEIFYTILTIVFGKSRQEIQNILPRYLKDIWFSRKLSQNGFQEGMQRFLSIVPYLVPFYPKLLEQLAYILYVLQQKNAINFDRLILSENLFATQLEEVTNDGPLIVEDYYRLIGQLFFLLKDSFENYQKMSESFILWFNDQFTMMKPLIIEENFFDEIEKYFGSNQFAKVITAILEQDSIKFSNAIRTEVIPQNYHNRQRQDRYH